MSAHQTRRSRKFPLALLVSGLAFIVTLVPAAMYGLPASAASAGSTLSQCTNGAAGPPTVLEQCAGSGNGTASILNGAVSPSGYANWVNGNANGSKAHWREGEFIPYRLAITGNAPGTYTAQLQYDTVHSGGHAIDYLGSYDASETTSTACPQTATHGFTAPCPLNPFHANYSNPCADLGMPASDCNNTTVNPAPAPAPHSTAPVPGTCPSTETNANCTSPDNKTAISQGATCGTSGSTGAVANGTFSQVQGTFDLFGPSGSTVNSVRYVSQNVLSGTNTCTTTLNVNFTIGGTSGTPTAVLAWGGHIASSVDWGTGNSASSISGSPYHMVLAACDCGGGKQDRALATSAVVFNTSTATQLSASSISVGGTASDTATVTGASSGATGTVTFTVFTNNTCTTLPTTGSSGQISAQPGQVSATNNGSGTLTAISPTVTFNQAGTYYWQAVYSGDTRAANTQPSTSPCTATNNEQLVVSSPNLTLTKTADASPVLAGNQIGFTVTLSNSGQGSATGIVLSDSLPSGSGLNWSLDTANSTIPTGISCTVTGTPPSQSLTCGATPSANSAFSLAGGATLKLHVISQTSTATCSTTPYTNTASFTSSNAGRGSRQAAVTVTCPNVSGTKTADASTVNAGGTIGFVVRLSNSGTGAATNEALTDNLPTGYTWTLLTGSGSGTSIPSGFTCDVHGTSPQVLSCGASPSDTGTFTLPAGATITLHVTAPVPTGSACMPGTVTNTASFGGNPPNASATVTVTCPNVTGTKTADASTVNAGGTIGFTVTLSNTGTGAATNEALNDTLPTGYTWSLVGNSVTSGSNISCALTATSPQVLSCGQSPATTGTFTLPAGATITLHVTAPVPSGSACVPGPVTNTAHFAGSTSNTGGQPDASATVTVTCPHVTGNKTPDANGGTVNAGTTIGFIVTLSNSGTGAATNETLSDNLPGGGLTWTLLTGSGSGTSIPSGITCDVHGTSPQVLSCGTSPSDTGTFTLAAGATITLHITSPTSGSTCGTFTNTATFGSSTSNAGSGSTPTASITVNCAILHVTKTACPQSSVVPGGILTYTIAFSNSGLGPANNAVLVDTLPAGVQVTSNGGGTVNGNTITWNLGPIAPNGSGTETIQVLVTAANGATLVNSVTLTSSSAATAATDQTTTSVSNAGAITHGEANWLNATALGLPPLDAGQVNTMATPSSPQAVAGSQLGPLNLLGVVSTTLVSDQSNSSVTDQATSTATTTIANVNLLDGAITADSVEGVSQSVATPTTASFNSTGSNFANLNVLEAGNTVVNLANVAPNTSVTVYNPLLPTQKLAQVVLYEQSGTSGLVNNLWSASHSVNMIDVTLLQPFLTLPAGAVIIVGHAQSDATYPSGLACGMAANTVSGEAFSALNKDTLLSNPLLGVLVGDAKLPPTGGSDSNQLAGVTLPDVVLNGTVVNSTSGSTTPTPNSTSSSSTQAVNLLGGLVTANLIDVSSTSQATGTSAGTTFGSTCTANTCPTGCSTSAPCFVNLAVNGTTLVGINGGTIKPNTTITIPQLGGGIILVILNEQITSGDGTKNTSGTVNAIHAYVLNGSGVLTAEVIVASAHSDAHLG